jgi:hypothetical protein
MLSASRFPASSVAFPKEKDDCGQEPNKLSDLGKPITSNETSKDNDRQLKDRDPGGLQVASQLWHIHFRVCSLREVRRPGGLVLGLGGDLKVVKSGNCDARATFEPPDMWLGCASNAFVAGGCPLCAKRDVLKPEVLRRVSSCKVCAMGILAGIKSGMSQVGAP